MLPIENAGNLVYPALFDLGERADAVIVSLIDGPELLEPATPTEPTLL